MTASHGRVTRAVATATVAAAALGVELPGTAQAHVASGSVGAALPLLVYVGGATLTVALSFGFFALVDAGPSGDAATGRVHHVPRWLRAGLRAAGLVAWLWIVAQALVGGDNEADVASLFLWAYGWVGLAIVSALVGPAWNWIDPFATLHDIAAAVARRLRSGSGAVRADVVTGDATKLASWPAVAGFAFFAWLELVFFVTGARLLGLVLVGYTIVTVAAMGQFGRDAWRSSGETFSVWFRLLGRMAPFALDAEDPNGVRRRSFASGLAEGPWSTSLLALIALAVGSMVYGSVAQTSVFFDFFGLLDTIGGTIVLAIFLLILVGAILWAARSVGVPAMTAGLIPVAAGFLIAASLSTLLVDGQRIVVALSDPFQQGWDLFGTATFHAVAWIPADLLWGVQLATVVGGCIVGASAAQRVRRGGVPLRSVAGSHEAARVRPRLLPLMMVMAVLSSTMVWSLGQILGIQ